MSILIFICIVIGVLFISYYINKQEWDRESKGLKVIPQELTKPMITTANTEKGNYLPLNSRNAELITEKLAEKFKQLKEDEDAFLFKGKYITPDQHGFLNIDKYGFISFNSIFYGGSLFIDTWQIKKDKFDEGFPYFDSDQGLFNLAQDVIREAVPTATPKKQIEVIKQKCGLFEECRERVFNDHYYTFYEPQWVSINNGKYYSTDLYTLYKFEDWSPVEKDEDVLAIIKGNNIEKCEDPYKTHWEHFLELEMKVKKQRELDCHKFVDNVLEKQIKYNDLQLKYEMLPSAPITDIETFKNFCKLVSEQVQYEDYEFRTTYS